MIVIIIIFDRSCPFDVHYFRALSRLAEDDTDVDVQYFTNQALQAVQAM